MAQGLGFRPRAAYWFPACEFEGQIAPLRPMSIRIVLLPFNASMPASSLGGFWSPLDFPIWALQLPSSGPGRSIPAAALISAVKGW